MSEVDVKFPASKSS